MKYLNWLILLSISINSYSNDFFLKDSIYNNIVIDSIEIKNTYPDFITKEYYNLDKTKIISSNNNFNKLYKISSTNIKQQQLIFNGLESTGSISRGFTIGNNQNSSYYGSS